VLGRPGRFQWEAAVQSVHAARRFTGRTDWAAIRLLYDVLLAATGSPVVAVNRAVAVAETEGAAAGLAALRAAAADARLAEYQPYWAALAALAERAGEAALAGLATDPALRAFLLGAGGVRAISRAGCASNTRMSARRLFTPATAATSRPWSAIARSRIPRIWNCWRSPVRRSSRRRTCPRLIRHRQPGTRYAPPRCPGCAPIARRCDSDSSS